MNMALLLFMGLNDYSDICFIFMGYVYYGSILPFDVCSYRNSFWNLKIEGNCQDSCLINNGKLPTLQSVLSHKTLSVAAYIPQSL